MKKVSIALIIVILAVIVAAIVVYIRRPKAAQRSNVITEAPVGTASMKLVPSKRTLKVGEQVSVDVVVDTAGDATTGIDVVLRYDPVLLEPVDADAATTGVQIAAGKLFDFVPNNMVTLATGLINFSASQQPTSQPVQTKDGKVATVTFKAKAAGSADVAFSHTPGASTDTNVVKAGEGRDLLNKVEDLELTIAN